MIKYHYFDVDHTLTRRSTGRNFIISAVKERAVSPMLLFTMPLYYLRYRYGKMHFDDLQEGIPGLKGISRNTLHSISNRAYDNKTKHHVYDQAKTFIHRVRKDGGHVFLASSSVDIILEPLARDLNVDDVIASKFEFSEDICTGGFLGGPALGSEKRARVLAHLEGNGYPAEECAFYSDSYHDIPIMEEVGKPVAINPDLRLTKHARLRNWEIIKFHA